MHALPTHSFPMTPLDEYTITKKVFRDPSAPLPKVHWVDYLDTTDVAHDEHSYDLGAKVIHVYRDKPEDIEVVLNDYDVKNGWTIEWMGKKP